MNIIERDVWLPDGPSTGQDRAGGVFPDGLEDSIELGQKMAPAESVTVFDFIAPRPERISAIWPAAVPLRLVNDPLHKKIFS
jgi:hypothetical protein